MEMLLIHNKKLTDRLSIMCVYNYMQLSMFIILVNALEWTLN